jgi:ATP-dependent DNA ligase
VNVSLPIPIDYAPMEADLARDLPRGGDWIYEPKWDGFRCLVFRDGDRVDLRSKANKPLARYFPDVAAVMAGLEPSRFVLDGELVIPINGKLVFDELLLRIHPAGSRVAKLAAAHPAHFIAFDLLVDTRGRDRTGDPLRKRLEALDGMASRVLDPNPFIQLSPRTMDAGLAERWLAAEHGGLDGVIAKRADLPYASGARSAMSKIKKMRTADCVVGGFRYSKAGRTIGSMLLGLYDREGLLHHVGFCSALDAKKRREAGERLVPLAGGEGFTGRAPGGASRWGGEGSGEYESLKPEVVVEVEYDHFSGGRFRHGTRLVRWRPDKGARQCTMEQVEREGGSALGLL